MPDPLTRLFMTTDAVGGVWTYALDLARGFAPHGVRTTLALLGPSPSAAQRADAKKIPGLALIDTDAPLDWLAEDEAAIANAAATMAALARQTDAQIIHLNTPALAALARFHAPVLGACHSCLATWWDAMRHTPLPDDFRWRTDVLARGYRACTTLIAPTAAFAELTAARYGIRPAVVHNGREPGPPPAPASRDRHVLTAGRLWDEGKNLFTLDHAAGRIDAPVLAAGPMHGPAGAAVTAANIVALGRLDPDALQAAMRRAPIFVSLALYEPFGLTVLEAAGAGGALVLSDIENFRELWDGAAVFVAARDDHAAATALQTLLDDPARIASLSKAARARAKIYTGTAMADRTLAIYRGLRSEDAAAA